jgi:hypothetical protein
MFRIRMVTPPMFDDTGLRYAAGELRVGPRPAHFIVDLSYWSIRDYEAQWRAALRHMLHGARAAALITAYRGADGASHVMWALWHEQDYVHVQEQTVVTAELDAPFDPMSPHDYIDTRLPALENALPIREWRVDNTAVYAAALGIRWPF